MRSVEKFDLSTLAIYNTGVAHKRGEVWNTRPLTPSENRILFEKARADFVLVNDVAGNREQQGMGYKYVSTNEPTPPLKDEVLFAKQRVVNAGYKKRSSSGEIVMAPYRVDNITCRYAYGSELVNPRNGVKHTLQPRSFRNDPWGVVIFDDKWQPSNLGSMTFTMTAYTYTEYIYTPFDLGWDLHPKQFREIFDGFRTTDHTLVTSALAGANEGKIDILTTLAEMPETIGSVISGLRLVAKLSKDAKNKEFSLTKNSARLRAKLDAKLEADLAKIDEQRRGANKHRQRLLDNHARKVKRLHRRNVETLLKELIFFKFSFEFRYSLHQVTNLNKIVIACINKLCIVFL